MKNTYIIAIMMGMILSIISCDDYLQEELSGELAPETLLSTQEGVESVLNSAYREYKFDYGFHAAVMENYEYSCDILFQTGGGMNVNFVKNSQFQWTAANSTANGAIWNTRYSSIRNTNVVIDNINNVTDENIRKALLAEARYIRAVNYIYLYDAFGPVPLRRSATDEPDLPRASEEELFTFIENELTEAAVDLPAPGQESEYGRATKGAALGFLTRFYLNTKQWQKAADAAEEIMDLNYYELYPSYHDLFKVENEPDKNNNNKEMIAVSPNTNVNPWGNKVSACAQPPGFKSTPQISEFEASGIANWASQFRFYDSYIATFDKDNDDRYSLIFDMYINQGGDTVDLSATPNNLRTLKFFDNTADVASHGNDFPMLRYADILLMRAEALNETNGPTQPAVDLINDVRDRAGLDDLDPGDFTKETLRDHILKERSWEFYYEGLRRSDLIRHDKYIDYANDRGIAAAQPHHVRYPIPQVEMDANDNMVQNDGYASITEE